MINPTPGTGPITLINVFEIGPDDVDLFLQEWQQRAQFLGRQPGFRSLTASSRGECGLAISVGQCRRVGQRRSVAGRDGAGLLPADRAEVRAGFAVTAHPAIYRVVLEATAD